MTNEQLYQQYIDGDIKALDKLYENNVKMLYKIVNIILDMFYSNSSEDKEELLSYANLCFVKLIIGKKFDPKKAKFSTYIYIPIKYALIRYLKAYKKYQLNTISAEYILTAGEVDLDYTNTIAYYERIQDKINIPIDTAVENRIDTDLLKKCFNNMSSKEQAIVGRYFGVFSYRQLPVKDIAMIEIMTEDGVYKFIDRTLKKLRLQLEKLI